jgi:hypothetical protein
MSRKVLLSILMVIVATGLVFTIAFAQSSQNIYPFFGGAHYYVFTDTSLAIHWSWLAASPGLVRVYLRASNHAYLLTDDSDGTVVRSVVPSAAEGYWGPVQVLEEPGVWADICRGQRISLATWHYSLGTLPPGDYTLTTIPTITHTLTDGCDGDSDGRPDIWRPGTTPVEVHIHVSE